MCALVEIAHLSHSDFLKNLCQARAGERKCRAGETLCGECKIDIAAKLNKLLTEHRERRVKGVID